MVLLLGTICCVYLDPGAASIPAHDCATAVGGLEADLGYAVVRSTQIREGMIDLHVTDFP